MKKNDIIRMMRKIGTTLSPVFSAKIMYFVLMKKRLNIKNPKTFNEKINWLKLKVFPKDELVIKCSDKYAVREYLLEKGCEKYLNNLIGVWEKVEDIDWDKLPNKFVIKCNHGCGYNIICKNKNKLDIEEAKRKLQKWMKEDFGKISGELHYSKIKKKIICEEFLEENILDYKIFCFDGKPEFFYIAQNVDGDFHDMQVDFYYPNGEIADFYRKDHKHFIEKPVLPQKLSEMLELSRKLSKDFHFVRVDLFFVNEKIYFSELTFTPCSGMMPLSPDSVDEEIGKKIDLKQYGKEK